MAGENIISQVVSIIPEVGAPTGTRLLESNIAKSAEAGMRAGLESGSRAAKINLRDQLDPRSIQAYSRPLGKLTGQADEFAKSMEAANARVLAFGASVSVLNGIASVFSNIVTSSMEVEKALKDIQINTNEAFNPRYTQTKIFQLAKDVGVSFKEASDATLEFSRQGAGLESSLKNARAALVLTATTGLDAKEAVLGLTAAVKSFGEQTVTFDQALNKLAAVDSKFAVSSRDLIEGISRSASVAQEAGVSFDELTSFIAVLQEKTARGGAVIGNALKTIFTRVQTQSNLEGLRNLNIAVDDLATGNALSATKIIENLALKFRDLDDATRKKIALDIGGGFQVDKVVALLKDIGDVSGRFREGVNISAKAGDVAYQRVEERQKTTAALFGKLSASAKDFAATIGEVGFSQDFKSFFSKGSEVLDTITSKFGDAREGAGIGEVIGKGLANGVVKAVGKVLTGPGVLIGGLLIGKLLKDLASFSKESLDSFLGANTQRKATEAIEKSVVNILSSNASLQNEILSLEGNRAAQAARLLDVYTQTANQIKLISQISKEIAPVLQAGGVAVASQPGRPAVTVGANTKASTASSGFMPIGEAYSQEKKNAPQGSTIIRDDNFPFGGGKRGTMFYNSSETRIKNFANGGDAIIPNFASSSLYSELFESQKEAAIMRNAADSEFLANKPPLVLDADKLSIAGLSVGGGKGNERTSIVSARSKFLTKRFLGSFSGLKNNPDLLNFLSQFSELDLGNLKIGNVYRLANQNIDTVLAKEDSIRQNFQERLNTSLNPAVKKFILDQFQVLDIKPSKSALDAMNSGKDFDFINESMAGTIFQSMLSVANSSAAQKDFGKFLGQDTSPFDIYNMRSDISEQLGLGSRPWKYVEVKPSNSDLKKEIAEKAINQMIADDSLQSSVRALSSRPSQVVKTASGGYIPNFAESGSFLGRGYSAEFYDMGGGVGEKRFFKNILDENPKKAKEEGLLGQKLAELNPKLKIAKFPQVYGFDKSAIKKEVITDPLVAKVIDGAIAEDAKKALLEKNLQSALRIGLTPVQMAGIYPMDLNANNYTANEQLRTLIQNILTGSGDVPSPEELYRKIKASSGIMTVIDSGEFYKSKPNKIELKKLEALKSQGLLETAHSGYVPNFSGKALSEAIKREQKQSGLPLSSIKVVQDSRVRGPRNPNGFAVINNRDEPNGKVPNFASNDQVSEAAKEIAAQVQQFGADLNETINNFIKNTDNFASSVDELRSAVESVIQNPNVSSAGNSSASVNIQAARNAAIDQGIEAATQARRSRMFPSNVERKAPQMEYDNGTPIAPIDLSKIGAYASVVSGKKVSSEAKQKLEKAFLEILSAKDSYKKSVDELAQEMIDASASIKKQSGDIPGLNLKAAASIASSAKEQQSDFQANYARENAALAVSASKPGSAQVQNESASAIPDTKETTAEATKATKAYNKTIQDSVASIIGLQAAFAAFDGIISGFGGKFETIGSIVRDVGNVYFGTRELNNIAEQSKKVIKNDKGEEIGKESFTKTLSESFSAARKASKEGGGGFEAFKETGGLKALTGLAAKTGIYLTAVTTVTKYVDLFFDSITESSKKALDAANKIKDLEEKSGGAISLTAQQQGFSDYLLNQLSTSGFGTASLLNNMGGAFLSKMMSRTGDLFGNRKSLESYEGVTQVLSDSGLNEDQQKAILNPILKQIQLAVSSDNNFKNKTDRDREDEITKRFAATIIRLGQRDVTPVQTDDVNPEEFRKRTENLLTGLDFSDRAFQLFKKNQPNALKQEAERDRVNQEGILAPKEVLQENLNSQTSIRKLILSIVSAKENELSIEKELNNTLEARKSEIDYILKSYEAQRGYLQDISSISSEFAKKEINRTVLGRKGSITDAESKQIEDAFGKIGQINPFLNTNKQVKEISSILQPLTQTNRFEPILKQQIDDRKKAYAVQQLQNALEAKNTAYIQQQNFLYSNRKDLLSAELQLQQKNLEAAKARLAVSREIEDTRFEGSLITQEEGRAGYQRAIRSANVTYDRRMEDYRNDQASTNLQGISSAYNYLSGKTNDPDALEKVAKAKTTEEAMSAVAEGLKTQSASFEQRVTSSAQEFHDIILRTGSEFVQQFKGGTPAPKILADSSPEEIAAVRMASLKNAVYAPKLSTFSGLDQQQTELYNAIEEFKQINPEQMDDAKNQLLQQAVTKYEEVTLSLQKMMESERKGKAATEALTNNPALLRTAAGVPVGPPSNIPKAAGEAKNTALKTANYQEYLRTDFTGGMEKAARAMENSIDTFGSRLGEEIPLEFRNSMVSALRELGDVNSTKSLSDRLMGIAGAFLQKISDRIMTNAVDTIMAPITRSTSSMLGGFASGGPISGGSGTKDDVPALLMGGEYVINKKAVQKYGRSFFDGLNYGGVQKFASGGFAGNSELNYQDYARNKSKYVPYGESMDQGYSFDSDGNVIGDLSYTGSEEDMSTGRYADTLKNSQTAYYNQNAQTGMGGPFGFFAPGQFGSGAIMGARNLLAFSTQESASGMYDSVSGSGGSASIDLAAGSSNMTLWGRRNSEVNKSFDEAREKAKELYFGELTNSKEKADVEERIRKEEEERKKREKEENKNFWKQIAVQFAVSVAMGVASAKIGQWTQAGGQQAQAAKVDATNTAMSSELQGLNANAGSMSAQDYQSQYESIFTSRGLDKSGSVWANATNTSLTNWETLKAGFSGVGKGMNPFSNSYQAPQKYLSDADGMMEFQGGKWNRISNDSVDWSRTTYGAKPVMIGGQMYYPASTSRYQRKAAGGYVHGNGNGDNVPAMLNGGEFVMSKQASEKLGYGNLQKMNSTGGVSSEASGETMSRLEAKLEELVEKVTGVGTINIEVNSSGKGDSEKESSSKNEDQQNREMARKIKEVVMNVLKDEKRLGGMLRN